MNRGSKRAKTKGDEEFNKAKIYMSLIARDNRPAALTLWPPATILLITQTELLWAVSGGSSQEHGSVCLRRLQKTRRGGSKGREGGKNLTHYSISRHKELGQILYSSVQTGASNQRGWQTHMHTLQGPRSGHGNTLQ